MSGPGKPRILFVDDDPDSLEGMRLLLRKQRALWEMLFAKSGEEALAELARGPIELVICDLLMPGMDGAALLEQVRARSPRTARVILSAHVEEASMARAMSVAHQYLSKPCDAETLLALIERTLGLTALLGSDAARAFLAKVAHLPSPPDTYLRLLGAIDRAEGSAGEVARIAEEDPAVSTKLLQIVNSAYFGLSRKVVSVQQAVAYLGLSLVRGVAMSANLFVALGPQLDAALVERMQRASLFAGQLGRKLAQLPYSATAAPPPSAPPLFPGPRVARAASNPTLSVASSSSPGAARPDIAFAAGLTHKVGVLVLAGCGQTAIDFSSLALPSAIDERAALGVTHAEAGAYLLGLWGLPAPLVEAVARSQEPQEAASDPRLVAIVHASCAYADAMLAKKPLAEANLDRALLERWGFAAELPRWQKIAEEQIAGAS